MKKNGKVGGVYSWPVIIIALCLFWPVGLFLLIKRVSVDKKTAMSVGKLIGIFGGISYAFAIVGIIACFSEGFGTDDVTLILFFGAAGFALTKVANKIKREAESIKQYLAIIVNGNVRQIDSVAVATGKPYNVVKADIQKMIKKGYLKNAYINENTREVVLLIESPTDSATFVNPVRTIPTPIQQQARIVACPCCGANNTIHGASGECEYCGSIIK